MSDRSEVEKRLAAIDNHALNALRGIETRAASKWIDRIWNETTEIACALRREAGTHDPKKCGAARCSRGRKRSPCWTLRTGHR